MTEPARDTEPLALLVAHIPKAARAGVTALVALDRQFDSIRAGTTEPLIGQMRLLWWQEALTRLDVAPPPAVPLLGDLARHAISASVTGTDLSKLVTAWEAIIDPSTDEREFLAAVRSRGESLFGTIARIEGGDAPGTGSAGAAWSLADAAAWRGQQDARRPALRSGARGELAQAVAFRWPRRSRALLLPALATAEGGGGAGAAFRVATFMMTGVAMLPRRCKPV